MKKAMEASKLMIQSAEKSYLPRINAFAAYQVNDYRLTGFGAGSYLAGLQLSWDIFKGNSTKNKMISRLLNWKTKVQVTELNKPFVAEDAGKIRQQTAAVENATEALRILQDRQGLVNSIDVAAQTQLSATTRQGTVVFSYNSRPLYHF
jgi:hypothetical protein